MSRLAVCPLCGREVDTYREVLDGSGPSLFMGHRVEMPHTAATAWCRNGGAPVERVAGTPSEDT